MVPALLLIATAKSEDIPHGPMRIEAAPSEQVDLLCWEARLSVQTSIAHCISEAQDIREGNVPDLPPFCNAHVEMMIIRSTFQGFY